MEKEKQGPHDDTDTDSVSDNSANGGKSKGIFYDHNKHIQKEWTNQKENLTTNLNLHLHPELSLYLGAPPEKIQQDPLSFWRALKPTYPNLSEIVLEFLAVVATSVPSERLFSKAGQIITKTRNRLEGKLASQLLFLNSVPENLW